MTIVITSKETRSGEFDTRAIFKSEVAIFLVEKAIQDIGDEIEKEAKEEAPEGSTGELKLHPIDRSGIYVGVLSQFGARAPKGAPGGIGGRFIRGPVGTGETVANELITVAKEPHYAIWVHDGTGIYGKHHERIIPVRQNHLIFRRYGKDFKVTSVEGQKANPYLERAFFNVNREYIPARIQELRAEIRAE